jgi:hypothetical protein
VAKIKEGRRRMWSSPARGIGGGTFVRFDVEEWHPVVSDRKGSHEGLRM